jgi:hypothetical protein
MDGKLSYPHTPKPLAQTFDFLFSCVIPGAFTQSSIKISNNLLVQALHLRKIYVAPSALGAVLL